MPRTAPVTKTPKTTLFREKQRFSRGLPAWHLEVPAHLYGVGQPTKNGQLNEELPLTAHVGQISWREQGAGARATTCVKRGLGPFRRGQTGAHRSLAGLRGVATTAPIGIKNSVVREGAPTELKSIARRFFDG